MTDRKEYGIYQIIGAIFGAAATNKNVATFSCLLLIINIVILLPKFFDSIDNIADRVFNDEKRRRLIQWISGLIMGFLISQLISYHG
jgi:uncharacterized membrane protein